MAKEIVIGREATIQFDAQKCIHSRFCVLSHPDVFVPNVAGAWIHPDAQPLAELIRIGQNCPSGAISVSRNGEGIARDVRTSSNSLPIVNTVRIRENGPLAIEAELQVNGEAQAVPRATLCRCGASQNKPYCDGAHARVGFVASGEPLGSTFEALESRNGPVNVKPIPDGPLHLLGHLEVVSGTGRTCNKADEAFFCRCGQSKNTPYCDGTHKAVGFQAP